MLQSALLARHRRRNHESHGRRMSLRVNGVGKGVDQAGGHRKDFGLWPRRQPYLAQQRLQGVQRWDQQQEGHPSHHHQTPGQMGAFFLKFSGSLVHSGQFRP